MAFCYHEEAFVLGAFSMYIIVVVYEFFWDVVEKWIKEWNLFS